MGQSAAGGIPSGKENKVKVRKANHSGLKLEKQNKPKKEIKSHTEQRMNKTYSQDFRKTSYIPGKMINEKNRSSINKQY